MLTRDFDFDLPAERIAQQPAPRGESRLLVLEAEGAARHRGVRHLPELLRRGDLVVLNDTQVIPARLLTRRQPSGGKVELLLVERIDAVSWDCLAKPGKKAQPGTRLEIGDGVSATVLDRPAAGSAPGDLPPGGGRLQVRFSEPIEPHLDRLGHVPLPPYIRRPDSAADRQRYQTVYARSPGAIAAPTAGLHLSEELLAAIRSAGAEIAAVTLHVGIGTFRPVTVERLDEHRMEEERYEISPETAKRIARARARNGRVIAVGTTVVRTLEGAAAAASPQGLGASEEDLVAAGSGRTGLFISPGFRFRVVDALLTNFHLPRSTLLMLVAAFAGHERILAAYREAVAAEYRFYSYGDAMFLERG